MFYDQLIKLELYNKNSIQRNYKLLTLTSKKLFILGDGCLPFIATSGFLKANLTFHIAFIAATKVKQDINKARKMIISVENQSIFGRIFKRLCLPKTQQRLTPQNLTNFFRSRAKFRAGVTRLDCTKISSLQGSYGQIRFLQPKS